MGQPASWWNSSRQALIAMAGGVVVMLGLASVIVAASIYYAASAIDIEARKVQGETILATLDLLARHSSERVKSLPAAYEAGRDGGARPDLEWWRSALQQHGRHIKDLSVLVVLDRNGQPGFGIGPAGQKLDGLAQELGGVLRDGSVSIERLIGTNSDGSHLFSMWQGLPSLITVHALSSAPTQGPEDANWSHVASVHRLDQSFLEDLRTVTGVATLNWSTEDAARPDFARIEINGTPRGFASLVWLPDRPGLALIDRAKPGLFLALGLLLVVSALAVTASTMAIRRLALQKLLAERLASTDQLTGLANRRFFNSALDRMIASPAEIGRGFSLMIVDLDRFKPLNDTHGHDAGDFALREIAGRLNRIGNDTTVTARLGGDEFAVLCPGVAGRDAAALAARIVAALCEPIVLPGGHQVMLGASVGVAEVPADGLTARDIVLRADAALYRAKEAGRNTAVLARDLGREPAAAA